MEKNVTVIRPKPDLSGKRVGIYCRVSTSSALQLNSLAEQASGLTQLVYGQWRMGATDIFLDVSSGADVVHRPEFQRMLQSVRDGRINYVVTKSISRFGRSTEDVLIAVRALREYGVGVYFESQDIFSLNPESELVISIFCGQAEAENKSHSENIRWGQLRHAQDGSSKLYNKPCYGYRQNESGDLEIYQDEANVVRRIYAMYLTGMSIVKIKAKLEAEGIPSPTGKEKWAKHTLEFMLTNTKYYGTSVIYKTHSPEYRRKRQTNNGEFEQYISCNNNPVIIPQEIFEQVQEERTRRSNVVVGDDGMKKRKTTKYSSVKK